MAAVKSEPGVKLEPGIKPDPGMEMDTDDLKPSPGGFVDDELYEDAGDLEFYDATQPQDPQGNAFLAHLPKYLYDQWAQLGDDEELVVGKVRTWTELDKTGQQVQKFAILADPSNPAHQNVPKEYTLEMRDPNLLNTFMFTEQDLPGFKNKYPGGPNNDIPAHLRPRPPQPKENGKTEGGGGGGRNRRREPYYRKAIPKKTVLAARFRREVNAQPVMTPETKHILAMRASDALKPKATTSIMSGTRNPVGIIHAGTAMGNAKMSGFVRTVDPKANNKKAKKEEKAARMEQSALLDAIFACYTDTKYDYWSMKAFKNRLKQPEAWLRENLEQVAVLHKTGRFANYWELKPEYQKRKPNAETAAEVADFDDEDDEDDNVEMEDVV